VCVCVCDRMCEGRARGVGSLPQPGVCAPRRESGGLRVRAGKRDGRVRRANGKRREKNTTRLSLPPIAAMSLQAVAARNTITLKGSAKLVTEYFAYAVNR